MEPNEQNLKQKDLLGIYPQKEQVEAFPERRYLKLVRFLTVFAAVNLACVMIWAGVYFYMAKNVDISVGSSSRAFLYAIDPEKKLLLPAELSKGSRISSLTLAVESILRRYLTERYSAVFDQTKMYARWKRGEGGYVERLSSDNVFAKFEKEIDANWGEIFGKRIMRDVHIYDLYLDHGDMWVAYIETFDFEVNENSETLCPCSDNSSECLDCKGKNTVQRQRKKIWMRAYFNNPRKDDYENPLKVMVYAFYSADIPIFKNDKETFWDLPPALRPDI